MAKARDGEGVQTRAARGKCPKEVVAKVHFPSTSQKFEVPSYVLRTPYYFPWGFGGGLQFQAQPMAPSLSSGVLNT